MLDIFEEDQLVERCAAAGRYVEEKLAAIKEKHTLVGSYSIRGIFFGVEFVKDRDSKEPAIKETAELVDNMKESGLLAQLNGYYNNRISFIPPINVSDSDVDDIFNIFDAEITRIEEKFGYK